MISILWNILRFCFMTQDKVYLDECFIGYYLGDYVFKSYFSRHLSCLGLAYRYCPTFVACSSSDNLVFWALEMIFWCVSFIWLCLSFCYISAGGICRDKQCFPRPLSILRWDVKHTRPMRRRTFPLPCSLVIWCHLAPHSISAGTSEGVKSLLELPSVTEKRMRNYGSWVTLCH